MGALKRRIGGALALAAGVVALDYGVAFAQPDETVLPEICGHQHAVGGSGKGARRNVAPGTGAVSRPLPPSKALAANSSGIVTGSIITGASSTVITAQDIARAPEQSIQDILSREPEVQVTNSFGGVNGARSTIDMRGFGAAAGSNTLILVNGRRLNDNDLAGATSARSRATDRADRDHPWQSGTVLYGDGAVGGVINIVTKTGGNQLLSARLEGGWIVPFVRGQRVVQRIDGALRGISRRRRDRCRRLSSKTTAAARRMPSATSAGTTVKAPVRTSIFPATPASWVAGRASGNTHGQINW